MWRRFELVDGRTGRFWYVRVRRHTCVVHFGNHGAEGQKRVLECADAVDARNRRDQLIRRKLASGYIEVDERETVAALRTVGAELKFRKNGRLRQVDLSFKPFSSALIPLINRATTLEHLNVRMTTFEDADLVNLKPSQQLTGIDVYGTQVTDEGIRRLPLFPNLEWLALSKLPISNQGTSYLAQLVRLQGASLYRSVS